MLEFFGHWDAAAATFFSHLNGQSLIADRMFGSMFSLNTFKVAPFVIILAALWMAHPEDKAVHRGVLAAAFGGTLSMFLTHLVQHLAPGRLRPWQSGYPFLKHLVDSGLGDHSSFPSDTAGLVCALALGILAASLRWGALAFVWVAVVDVGGKLFSGDHYPSDIIAGALIGLAATSFFLWSERLIASSDAFASKVQTRHPLLFFMVIFFVMMQLSTLFDDLRSTGNALLSRHKFEQAVSRPH